MKIAARRLSLIAASFATIFAVAPMPALAQCNPFVAEGPVDAPSPLLRLAAAELSPPLRLASTPPGHVTLTFLGHASFMIETASGIAAVTDYNGYHRPPRVPDIVTMNNAHSTHYTDAVEPGVRYVLRGWNPTGGPADHDIVLGEMRVRNLPTNTRDFAGTRYSGNSIFVFEAAGLCIAHLSHLHHRLTPEHVRALGKIDVVLPLVDGSVSLGQEGVVETIDMLKPSIVVPSHYFSDRTLTSFLALMRGRYAIRLGESPSMLLSRDLLPQAPEVVVLPGR